MGGWEFLRLWLGRRRTKRGGRQGAMPMRRNTVRRSTVRQATLRQPPRQRTLAVEACEVRAMLHHTLYVVEGTFDQAVAIGFEGLGRSAGYRNEVGVFRVEDAEGRVAGLLPSDPGYAEAAVRAARLVFGGRTPSGATQQLLFSGGDRLGFVLIQNGTMASFLDRNPRNAVGGGPLAFFSLATANPDRFDHLRISHLPDGTVLYAWEDETGGGDRDFNDVVFRVGAAGSRALREENGQGLGERMAQFTLISRSAAFTNELGMFLVDDEHGRIGNLRPGDAGYLQAALDPARRTVLFSPQQHAGSTTSRDLPLGSMFGIYMVANGTTDQVLSQNPRNHSGGKRPNVFFSFVQANPDGIDHFRWLNGTDVGVEDKYGGGDRDYDDVVFRVQIVERPGSQPIVGNPPSGNTPQDTTPPADPRFDLHFSSDTGTTGDQTTALGIVDLLGQTDPNTIVELYALPGGGQGPVLLGTVTSDGTGRFTFSGVALALGSNAFRTEAADAAGNRSRFEQTFQRVSAPAVAAPLQDLTIQAAAGAVDLELDGVFDDPDLHVNTLLRMQTSMGNIELELFDDAAPQTVANFLNYVNDGDYRNTIIHRSIPGFVIQGGGYQLQTGSPRLVPVPTDPPVVNEPGISNTRGTLAMAKQPGDPNSATSQWFINLADNSSNLDQQNGGFTVFGQVLDMAPVDAIAAVPTFNFGGAFTDVPLRDFTPGTTFPDNVADSSFVIISDVAVTRRRDRLSFTAVSSDLAVVTPAVTGTRLTLAPQAGVTGTAQITVRATDLDGNFVEFAFTVTVT